MKFDGTLVSVCDYLEITSAFKGKIGELLSKLKVTGIESDSRRVTKGTIYYARKGAHFNPFEHLEEIKAKGAIAILIDAPEDKTGEGWQSVLNYSQSGDKIKEASTPAPAPAKTDNAAKAEEEGEEKNDPERNKRTGKDVLSSLVKDPELAVRQYQASGETPEAAAISDARMLRLVLPTTRNLSALAGFIYDNPSEKLRLIGVTGTNGKSTITSLIAQMLTSCGQKCAVFGTLGYGFLDDLQPAANTTLDAISMQRELANYVEKGAKYAVMEVSSIGFCEGRVSGLSFYAGAFSNLSRDHLDYHKTMEDYFEAKLNFLRMIPVKHLVINEEGEYGAQLVEQFPEACRVSFKSAAPARPFGAQINVRDMRFAPAQSMLSINITARKNASARLNLLGRFNVQNYAVALGVLVKMGYDFKHLMRHASELKPVTGRMECFTAEGKPRMIVDYAHTPDGVEQALRAAACHTQGSGRIFAIIGCGGDRDTGKRPLMALKSSVYADYAIFTADNPRSENLDYIIDDMLLGVDSNIDAASARATDAALEQIMLICPGHPEVVKAALKEVHTICQSSGDEEMNQVFELFNTQMLAHLKDPESAVLPVVMAEEHTGELFWDYAARITSLLVESCAKDIGFDEYERLRIARDDSIVNSAAKGKYYAEHQSVLGMPLSLNVTATGGRNVLVVKDRYQAIRFAYEHAGVHDCVVVAGKGHEDYQIFADRTIHFSDREVCCELLGINMDGTPVDDHAKTSRGKSSKKTTAAAAKKTAAEAKTTAAAKMATAAKATSAAAKKTAAAKATAAAKKTTAAKATASAKKTAAEAKTTAAAKKATAAKATASAKKTAAEAKTTAAAKKATAAKTTAAKKTATAAKATAAAKKTTAAKATTAAKKTAAEAKTTAAAKKTTAAKAAAAKASSVATKKSTAAKKPAAARKTTTAGKGDKK